MSSRIPEPIAIIGSACRFAGDATSPSKLWELLREPRDVLSKIPESRFSAEGFYHADAQYHGHSNVLHSYLLSDDPAAFDTHFFGIKPIEARAMDPQQRLLLEVVYEGLEAAGIPHQTLRGSDTAVYVGQMCSDYEVRLSRDIDNLPTYHSVGVFRSITANRVSYVFDWHGPSMTIDTACSSSLVAVHLAAQALRSGSSRMALACGVNLLLGPDYYVSESKLKMLSSDSRCRMWDEKASGYARGDGVAAVVLKTLSAALEDGDHIECIIRQTGVNQDGATTGITVPSASAQAGLIRDTYKGAGLDPLRAEDRCHYFEAHGTGTPAGDPVEAEAIHQAFFGKGAQHCEPSNTLFVGSVKTVLGHTEGAAGIAGLLKASLALQNALIPPNLLFDKLNPRISPFYHNLHIPTAAGVKWPEIPVGAPRRASVNSFGFGGTNAHAILESYENALPIDRQLGYDKPSDGFIPFQFSASCEQSLQASLKAHLDLLEHAPSCSSRDLAWTLQNRRSVLSSRISFPAGPLRELVSSIKAELSQESGRLGSRTASLSAAGPARILGIFTGQGAQYPRMGAALVERSPFVRQRLEALESYLGQLPERDRPPWSLTAELLASAATSRLHEATISQPLTTAIQIVLVDMLRLARVELRAVVGHSSGEIGAAYAAGHLSARDAIIIAYYRGLHSRLARSPNGERIEGAMLAAGTSVEDAEELCALPEFAGRVVVAACNAPSTVTFSGDEDAISELELVLGDEKKFHRRLRVDKAYHSPHMLSCSEPYFRSLNECGVRTQNPPSSTVWFSSVQGCIGGTSFRSDMRYWIDNMVGPVLFEQALRNALSNSKPNLVLEIGPHPALKGPASQTILDIMSDTLTYHGMLSRDRDAVVTTSAALGAIWTHLGPAAADLSRYDELMSGKANFQFVRDLPTYRWNHEKAYWHESQLARRIHRRKPRVHPLLGHMCPDSSTHCLRWRHVLRPNEISWIADHRIQGQTVFPAAGYVVTALECSPYLAEAESVRLVEIRRFHIHQAMIFDDDNADMEITVILAEISRVDSNMVRAQFSYSAGAGRDDGPLNLMASAEIELVLGKHSPDTLPKGDPEPPNMLDVNTNKFYSALSDIGYGYGGYFRGLSGLRRRLGRSRGHIQIPPTDKQMSWLVTHPAVLDSAFQSVILAHSYPGDGHLWSLHVPTSIEHIRVNTSLCGPNWEGCVPFDSVSHAPTADGVTGDVDIYIENSTATANAVQIQGIHFVPLAEARASDDTKMFSCMDWAPEHPDAEEAARDDEITAKAQEISDVMERISTFYLRKFLQELPLDHAARSQPPFSHYLNYAQHINQLQANGKCKFAKKEWISDHLDDILAMGAPYNHEPELRILHTIGEQMPRVFRGETTILEQLHPNGLLNQFYSTAICVCNAAEWVARIVKQVAHRYPNMSIIEIGAGTGGATKRIFDQIDNQFTSYTFTDISAGFFQSAEGMFISQRDSMQYQILDIERDPTLQGFPEHQYDMVVASFVLHATAKLEDTMRNVRRLLRPGGFLVVAECTDSERIWPGFIFGTFPGWWAGVAEGRTLSPAVAPVAWDAILRQTGFSGIETISPEIFADIYPGCVFVSRASDDRVAFLQKPLASPAPTDRYGQLLQDLTIVGGATLRTAGLVHDLKNILGSFASSTNVYRTLGDVPYSKLTPSSTILSLAELDTRVFQNMETSGFDNLKNLFLIGNTVLWVTHGRRHKDPFSNMTVGFGRTIRCEVPELELQFLDLETIVKIEPRTIAETLLRFCAASRWAKDENHDTLWSIEPELVIDEGGRALIPRLRELDLQNDRYNSARRVITRPFNSIDGVVEVQVDDVGGYFLTDNLSSAPDVDNESTLCLVAEHSLLLAIETPMGYKHLTVGADRVTGQQYLVLTERLASVLYVPRTQAYACQTPPSSAVGFLSTAAAHIASRAILDTMRAGQMLLVHNSNALLERTIADYASKKEVRLVFTTDSHDPCAPSSWIRIPIYTPRRKIQELLPDNATCFFDLSAHGSGVSACKVESFIRSCLPSTCRIETVSTVLSAKASVATAGRDCDDLPKVLRSALRYHQYASPSSAGVSGTCTLSLQDLTAGVRPTDVFKVLEWTTSSQPMPVRSMRLDPGRLIKPNKTYWLVGLTGSLGISFCDWMATHGATHIVLSSRRPKVDPAWIDQHARKGTIIKVFENDVTKAQDLSSLYETICETCPPIMGVVQGAMVLRDTTLRNMSFDQMVDVLGPKVDGSINLENIFHDSKLDFFVFLSSLVGVIGTIGQANYSAANNFMCSLAAQRRKRGLAASVVNIGAVIGVGYISRQDEAVEQKLHVEGLMGLSERDLHQIFAEAIEAGRPGLRIDAMIEPEISAGLRQIDRSSSYIPPWCDNPIFSKFSGRDTRDVSHGATPGPGTALTPKEQLQAAATLEEARRLVRNSLVAKLRSMLQTEIADDELTKMRTDEIGLDSLIAVDLRSWMLKSYQANVPVLKLLSGLQVADLVELILQSIPTEIANQTDGTSSGNDSKPDHKKPVIAPPQNLQAAKATSGVRTNASLSPASIASSVVSFSPETQSFNDHRGIIVNLAPEARVIRTSALSSSQSMFWVVHHMMHDKTTLNHAVLWRVHGRLRGADLGSAILAVAHRHEALRTCFFLDHEYRPVQGVADLSGIQLEEAETSGALDALEQFRKLSSHVFDLASGQTFRIRLVSDPHGQDYLMLAFHHLAFDGLSVQVLLSELEMAYRGMPSSLESLQFLDYVSEETAALKSKTWDRHLSFWKQELGTLPDPLPIARGQSRTTERQILDRYKINSTHLCIDAALASQVREVARKQRATTFHLYLAAFKVLLHHLTGACDLCIGVADGGRRDDKTTNSIGSYLNLVPLRLTYAADHTLGQAIAEAREKTYAALEHSSMPLETILNELCVPRARTHSPLFQAFIDYRHGPPVRQAFADCDLERMEVVLGRTAYDISLDIIDTPGQDALVTVMGQSYLYAESDVRVFADIYKDILNDFVSLPTTERVSNWQHRKTAILSVQEHSKREASVNEWSQTLMHHLERFMHRSNTNIAVRGLHCNPLTYAQLSNRVDCIASALLGRGVDRGQHVAVFQEPLPDWICSMLAIMKIGAVYVPLDPGTRVARLASMVRDCRPVATLVDDTTREKSREFAISDSIVNVSDITDLSSGLVPTRAESDSSAMLLYTSGTTGSPKAIVLKHAGLSNEIRVAAEAYGLDATTTVLQQSSLGFDMSVYQILVALAVGGTLCMTPLSIRGDTMAILDLLHKCNITHTCATPSEYSSWLRHSNRELLCSAPWQIALSGGEPITESLLESFRRLGKPDLRLFNGYGPTETTICSSRMELAYKKKGAYRDGIPAGFASRNEAVYIVDENMRLLPTGVPGEILIGGVGVAQGYLNNDTLNKQVFSLNPYATAEFLRNGWTSLYHTRDRGRFLDDGSLMIMGRIDDDTEIKLRGQRIDLKAIELAIAESSNGDITEVAASMRSPAGNESQFLVAHIVFADQVKHSNYESLYLKSLVAKLPLPDYMCPSVLVPVDSLPMTSSGKLDRTAVSTLPLVTEPPLSTALAAQLPLTNSERHMKALWEEVLPGGLFNFRNLVPETDFFQVGGTSLLLVEIQAQIQKQFRVSAPLADLFSACTLGSMARHLDTQGAVENETKIDWDLETKPPPPSRPGTTSGGFVAPDKPAKTVLLTDSNHFLGRHLLQDLLSRPEIETVICISTGGAQVSGPPAIQSPIAKRIVYYEGKLHHARIGLSEGDAAAIFSQIDAVIHNAAVVSHLKNYTTLRAANVTATKEILKLCLPRRIPIHYVSTVGVALFAERTSFTEVSAAASPPPSDGSLGYWASKWAAERLLERAASAYRLPIFIHRHSSIVASGAETDGDEAVGDDSTLEIVDNILRYTHILRCAPSFETLSGALDFVGVKSVSAAVATAVTRSSSQPRYGMAHMHHTSEWVVPLEEMAAYCASTVGQPEYAVRPIGKWLEAAITAGMNAAVAQVIRNLGMSDNEIKLPRFERS
ncbi:beta-ketoacyl synthase domain-containing protein [Thozetella sp. PMI_491]|nr:beta-ketoacyl synthase domain-containing protein [Thozetella sp. PMI_491]